MAWSPDRSNMYCRKGLWSNSRSYIKKYCSTLFFRTGIQQSLMRANSDQVTDHARKNTTSSRLPFCTTSNQNKFNHVCCCSTVYRSHSREAAVSFLQLQSGISPACPCTLRKQLLPAPVAISAPPTPLSDVIRSPALVAQDA